MIPFFCADVLRRPRLLTSSHRRVLPWGRLAMNRCLSWKLSALAVIAIVATSNQLVTAAEDDIVCVEEMWEIVVAEPDEIAMAPQVSSAYSPIQDDDVFYAMFSMNHHHINEEFRFGGLQLQLWHGDDLLAERTSDKRASLTTPGEKISWTQKISVDDNGKIVFRIVDGKSATWGDFGDQLWINVQTSLTSLNSYKPSNSLKSSGTFFGANRVLGHKLNKIRVTRRSGEVTELIVDL